MKPYLFLLSLVLIGSSCLTHDERNAKSDQHKFGLCCDCDAGLDDRADFIIGNHATYTRLLCNDCSAYYAEACTALRVRRFLAKMTTATPYSTTQIQNPKRGTIDT